METRHIIVILFLALLWLWLCWILVSAGGLTGKNAFLIVASGIIIFVPLWKRYIRPSQGGGDKRDNRK
ncbi:MAG: hypothetical protein K2O24_01520 [Muribaculaceae bacterium]|nr:hypothetical protein [Muribaculaceae bacterium]